MVLLPPLSVFIGGKTFHLFKHSGKIVYSAHAAFVADIFYSFIRKAQKLLGMSDSFLQQIVVDGGAELFFKYSGQIKFVDIKVFRKFIQSDFLGIVLVQIVFDLGEVLFVRSVFVGGWMPAFFHQTGHQAVQAFIDTHVADVVGRSGDGIKTAPNMFETRKVSRAKAGLSASFYIFGINIGEIGTIKMDPTQLPQIFTGSVGVGQATVEGRRGRWIFLENPEISNICFANIR